MKKLYYVGLLTTILGTIAFCICLINHIEDPALHSIDLLESAVIISIGALIMRLNEIEKNNKIV